MQSRHIHEAVDCTFQDVWNSDCPFGGLCVVFEILNRFLLLSSKEIRHKLLKFLCSALLFGSLSRFSSLYKICGSIQQMNKNLNLHNGSWILDVGDTQIKMETFTAERTRLSHSFKLFILASHIMFFQQTSILQNVPFWPAANCNDDVDSINKDILRQFPGEVQTFLGADSIKNNNGEGGQDVLDHMFRYDEWHHIFICTDVQIQILWVTEHVICSSEWCCALSIASECVHLCRLCLWLAFQGFLAQAHSNNNQSENCIENANKFKYFVETWQFSAWNLIFSHILRLNCCHDRWRNANMFSSAGHMMGDWTCGHNSGIFKHNQLFLLT